MFQVLRMSAFRLTARLLSGFALAGLYLSSGGALYGATPIPATQLWIPAGFDDNDDVVIVAEGVLPDTCHQLSDPSVEVGSGNSNIAVTLQATVAAGQCAPVPVPFQQEIYLGQLTSGIWSVTVNGLAAEQLLNVARATGSGIDDYIYAPVERVKVKVDEATGQSVIQLRGKLSVSCLTWKEARLIVQPTVFVILPILEQTSTDCRPATRLIAHDIPVPSDLANGRYLIHVRSLNGRAINHVFNWSQP